MIRAALMLLFASALHAQGMPAQQVPTPAAAEWWRLTAELSSDAMQGRDTGSEAYVRAAGYVAEHLKADGLRAAGDGGSYLQQVPMHQVALVDARSTLIVHRPGAESILHFNTDLATTPHASLNVSGPIVFLGYGLPAAGDDLRGKMVLYFNGTPAALSAAARDRYLADRARALSVSGAAALLAIDNLNSIEPSHWPSAYSRSVTLAGTPPASGPALLRVNPDSLAALLPDREVATILAAGGRGDPLPALPAGPVATLQLTVEEKDIASPNIVAVLPGSDPARAAEYVALSAHLDGYGLGAPVLGDSLYNGTLDDAAYVATLLELAHNLARHPPARSLLFCIFTGEEKGLLGSTYFTRHPTVPIPGIVADLNLDQLRPIFPLRILTMEGIADSTLGETARQVAQPFHIELRPDRETERNLFRRADNYSFVKVGVPIASFIFGYDPGTAEEHIYRDWYARRYHKPQDDLATPIDWAAAVRFNDFYRALVLAVADAPKRPQWLPASDYAPRP